MQVDPPLGHATSLPLRLGFAAALLAAFGALLAFAAVAPQTMARPVAAGIPLSLILAALMIAFAIGSTGAYVILANRRAP